MGSKAIHRSPLRPDLGGITVPDEGTPAPGADGRKSAFKASGPDFARGMNLAFEFVGAVVLFWFVGRLVDGWLGIEPWGQVAGAVVGWIGGILHVYYKSGSNT